MTDIPRVRHNDWSSLSTPALGSWQPELTVSVIIPAYDCQDSLDLTLAALARQTYPQDLLEVIVVDDNSEPPLRLPDIGPKNCRLVRPPKHTHGVANAVDTGVRVSSGQVIQRLDADMVTHPQHIEALSRWHTAIPYAVVLGDKEFVDVQPGTAGWPTPADVFESEDLAAQLQGLSRVSHDYHEKLLRTTDQLRRADHLGFMGHVGATVSLRREMYDRAGGYDASLSLGEDTELGFRLSQSGAVFVHEAQARSWHLGRTHMMNEERALQRYSRPHLASRMPLPRWLRKVGGSAWSVPLVTVVVEVGNNQYERVRATIDSVLKGSERDLQLYAVGPWGSLATKGRRALVDPHLDLRLLAATYQSDPRVHLVEQRPEPFPSPYVLHLPATAMLASSAISRLIGEADQHQAGLVVIPSADGDRLEFWRTAALSRARWICGEVTDVNMHPFTSADVTNLVEETFGVRTLRAADIGMLETGGVPIAALASGVDASVVPTPGGRWLPPTVEVGGVRTLALAALVVARASARRFRARLSRKRREAVRTRDGRHDQ